MHLQISSAKRPQIPLGMNVLKVLHKGDQEHSG